MNPWTLRRIIQAIPMALGAFGVVYLLDLLGLASGMDYTYAAGISTGLLLAALFMDRN